MIIDAKTRAAVLQSLTVADVIKHRPDLAGSFAAGKVSEAATGNAETRMLRESAAAEPGRETDPNMILLEAFRGLGMTEDQAQIAARGREWGNR